MPTCQDCGKQPPVPYHQRCQACILRRLPKGKERPPG